MSSALYFVAPTPENIQRIKDDFYEEDMLPFDQYGQVGIVFVGDAQIYQVKNLVDQIVENHKLTTRVNCLQEWALFGQTKIK